jgi:hypothetical protein
MIDLSGENSSTVADWIEALAASQSGKPLSMQKVQEISQSFANIGQNVIPFAFRLLEKRQQVLKDLYPFAIDDTFIVTRKTVRDSFYLQMLFLTPKAGLFTSGSTWNLEIASQLFEDLTEKALSNFFGNNTHTANFGFPSRSGRPAEFSAAVEWLSKKTNIRLGNAYRPPRKKDGGVDLFVWKSFSDNQPGIPVMLVQCTIKEDFINKIGDIDLRLWANWLSSDIEPLVALAVPGVVTKEEVWGEITTRGILLDRMRLTELAAEIHDFNGIENKDYSEKLVAEFAEHIH